MPRGRPKKVVEVPVETKAEAVTVVVDAPVVVEEKAPAVKVEEKPKPQMTDFQKKLAESRKVLDIPLTASQEFYESPEGFIVIGEKGRGRVWCREANNFKGMWINPRR